jgi:hypothetical protein
VQEAVELMLGNFLGGSPSGDFGGWVLGVVIIVALYSACMSSRVRTCIRADVLMLQQSVNNNIGWGMRCTVQGTIKSQMRPLPIAGGSSD